MRPLLEKVSLPADASWTLLNRRLEAGIPFEWHHHPEYELTLTTNSRGRRFVGDSIAAYGDGDLVLLGPNVPHTWFSEQKIAAGEPHVALVMWFRAEWADNLTGPFVEMRAIRRLLESTGRGLVFSPPAAAKARPLIEAMPGLSGPPRWLALLQVLHVLAEDADTAPLASTAFQARAAAPSDRNRIERVLDHIHAQYHRDIRIEDLARLSHLSASGFQRLFRRHTQLAVTDYVMQLRIGQACALLLGTDKPIAHIAADVGYRNLSNFNRQFLQVKGMAPRVFRQAHRFRQTKNPRRLPGAGS